MSEPAPFGRRLGDILAFAFALVILFYAAGGPIGDFVRWFVETTTEGFHELSRREQRLAMRENWLGAAWRGVEGGVLQPTGLILGLPILFGLVISSLSLDARPWLRWLLALAAAVSLTLWIVEIFATDAGLLPSADTIDFVVFPVAAAVTLYLTWRMFGSFIALFCLFWVLYFFTRGLFPGWTGILSGSDASFAQNLRAMVQQFWAQTGGMFGQPIQVVTGNVLIFIVFGAVLMASGAGDLLLKIANRLTGGFTGGAAHASVASSALFGTLSGAAISNVVSTGVMTIPVIKRAGFKPAFAGAVEAAASTGGQVMPPVMGVVAFFVAGQIGLEYRYIVVAAILPALMYYLGTFMAVWFEARRSGIGALPLAARPGLNGRETRQCLVFVIPLGVLSTFLFVQPSVPKAGFYGFLAALVTALALFPEFRNRGRLWRAFVDAGRMSANIVVIVAAIGLIVGLIQLSGFAGRLSLLLAQLADGPLFLVLVVVAFGATVLGMGLPPGATYFIIVIALSSGIDAVGIPELTLHLFVVFFAVMSTVTPPVALAAFAAAPIAGADPIRTGFEAAKIGVAGFLIPFVFAFHPAVLYKLQALFPLFGGEISGSAAMIDPATVSWAAFAWIAVAFAFSMWLIHSALAGFETRALAAPERALRLAAGLAILAPQFAVALPAAAVGAGLVALHRMRANAGRHGAAP
ncbi:TRAP transporter fused permease subunit [Rhodobacterales bacterium HKCCE2091]|nr:TRAP transporter fused permease subunit [Rhodobacterales bacterium HKCCE2091]